MSSRLVIGVVSLNQRIADQVACGLQAEGFFVRRDLADHRVRCDDLPACDTPVVLGIARDEDAKALRQAGGLVCHLAPGGARPLVSPLVHQTRIPVLLCDFVFPAEAGDLMDRICRAVAAWHADNDCGYGNTGRPAAVAPETVEGD